MANKGQKGRVPQKLRLQGYPFNKRDAELQSEAGSPKDPRWSDANTRANERIPTMDLTQNTKPGAKIGNSKKTTSTMTGEWDGDAKSLDETNVRMQFVEPSQFDSPSE